MSEDVTTLDEYCLSPDFQEIVERQLEYIDDILARRHERVHSRPMLASMLFAEECIVPREGGRLPPEYLEHEWFGRVVAITTLWYRSKYGAELLESPASVTNAVVYLFGTTFTISIRSFPTRPSEESGTAIVFFAKEVLNHEEPTEWLVPRVNMGHLSDDLAEEVRRRVLTVCNLIRRIQWGLGFPVLATDELRNQCESILGHLENGAADICASRYGTAVWAIHLGVELSLKLFLAQRGVSAVPHTHELPELMRLAVDAGLPAANEIDMNVLPTARDAIRHRYSEIPEPPLAEVIGIYETALRLVAHVASALSHHDLAIHERVYLRALPWHPSRKASSKPDAE